MTDTYINFEELAKNEREGDDYTIIYRQLDTDIAIMAPHGGGIEPGTLDIADALAGGEYTFYAFKGLKKEGNRLLHLTCNRLDEPTGLRLARDASLVISIHGSHFTGQTVFIGGKDQVFKEGILQALRAAGFDAAISEIPRLRGIDPENICNKGRSGKGVQLEISRGLREKMFETIDRRSVRTKTIIFYNFINAVQRALHILTENQNVASSKNEPEQPASK